MPDDDLSVATWGDPRLTWGMPGLVWGGREPAPALNPTTTMADANTKQLSPSDLKGDADAVIAIANIPTYAPPKADFALAVMKGTPANNGNDGVEKKLSAAEAALVTAEAAFNAARDGKVALEWQRHNWVVGARKQVAAQFGDSSDELASTGLKKKSEYKKPTKKKPTPPTP